MGNMSTDYVATLDWGYIIIENFHVEQLFKAILYVHKEFGNNTKNSLIKLV